MWPAAGDPPRTATSVVARCDRGPAGGRPPPRNCILPFQCTLTPPSGPAGEQQAAVRTRLRSRFRFKELLLNRVKKLSRQTDTFIQKRKIHTCRRRRSMASR